jgi:hypothetical protein
LAGYEDTNDAERLAEDPAFRMLASRERRETSVALTSTLHWFETEVLAEERNYQGLARLNTDLVQHEAARPLARRLILDIDSSESPVAIQSWSLTSLQQRLFKTGGRLIRHARYFVLQLAESYLTSTLFRQILGRIERLAWHPT